MFKILHQIASNVHSPAACKIYTKVQNPPPRYSRGAETGEISSGLSSCCVTPALMRHPLPPQTVPLISLIAVFPPHQTHFSFSLFSHWFFSALM